MVKDCIVSGFSRAGCDGGYHRAGSEAACGSIYGDRNGQMDATVAANKALGSPANAVAMPTLPWYESPLRKGCPTQYL